MAEAARLAALRANQSLPLVFLDVEIKVRLGFPARQRACKDITLPDLAALPLCTRAIVAAAMSLDSKAILRKTLQRLSHKPCFWKV